jgi:butyryl-CoA dehydrogenase
MDRLKEVTSHLKTVREKEGYRTYIGDATVYLDFFSLITVSWQWLVQAIAAVKGLEGSPSKADSNFYQGKLHCTRYFYRYELPKTLGLARCLMDPETVTMDMEIDYFAD